MTRHRALAALLLACVLALFPATRAAATPSPGPIQTVQLSGICPFSEGQSKEVSTVLIGKHLLAPYFLFDAKGAWTGAILMPYDVLASGEGLKSRHLLPGEYLRPGPAPKQPITCDFAGTTPDGNVSLHVVGGVIQVPKLNRPR